MRPFHQVIFVAALLGACDARAQSLVISKIYHPYVDALESEFEYRALVQDEQHGISTQAQVHQVSLGTSVGSRLFAEMNLIGSRSRGGWTSLEAWEAELKWQLTEQGEYGVDWGLQLEYEDSRRVDVKEFTAALLAEREWGNWSGTANLSLTNRWGNDIAAGTGATFAMQARYRYSRLLEPAVEFYAGKNTRGIGPVFQGTFFTGVRKSIHWEAGLIFGLDNDSADQTWRLLFEYEF